MHVCALTRYERKRREQQNVREFTRFERDREDDFSRCFRAAEQSRDETTTGRRADRPRADRRRRAR